MPQDEEIPEQVPEHVPDNAFANLRPHGSKMRVKALHGWVIYELTPNGWLLIGEEPAE